MKHHKFCRQAVLATCIAAILALGLIIALAFTGDDVYRLDAPQSPTGWHKARHAAARYVGQLLLPLFYEEHTTYASGFSETAFRSLRVGVSEAEVLAVLGEPLLRTTLSDGGSVLYYSQQATPRDNYLVRNVLLDRHGRVTDRHAEFYVD